MEKKICILCNCEKFEILSKRVRDSKKHKILKCKKCKHVQLFPIPTSQEDKKFYDENLQDKNINYFGTIKENRKKSLDDTTRRANAVKKIVPKHGKILEIGSGHGFFLEAMKKLNYDIIGIEVSNEKRKLSKRVTNAKILNVNLNYEIPNISNYDAVVLFHVLEHISNPVNFLKRIKKAKLGKIKELIQNGKK